MLFSPLTYVMKVGKGHRGGVGNPWGDWMGNWEGTEVEATPTWVVRRLQLGFLGPFPPLVLFALPLAQWLGPGPSAVSDCCLCPQVSGTAWWSTVFRTMPLGALVIAWAFLESPDRRNGLAGPTPQLWSLGTWKQSPTTLVTAIVFHITPFA